MYIFCNMCAHVCGCNSLGGSNLTHGASEAGARLYSRLGMTERGAWRPTDDRPTNGMGLGREDGGRERGSP